MTHRETLIEYVKHGGDKAICSPQIGAGAGFDTKIAGKTWIGETTFEDTRRAYEMFDVVPLYNFGLPDLWGTLDGVEVAVSATFAGGKRMVYSEMKTPKGTLFSETVEQEYLGISPTKYYITEEEELDVLENAIDMLLAEADFSMIARGVCEIRDSLGMDVALDIQWAMQPYELLCFPNTVDTAVFAMTAPDIFKRLMDKILRLNEKLLPQVAAGGADFVFLGCPGAEMVSPAYYENMIVPYSEIVTQMAHKNGLLVYMHVCSPIEPMLTKGYFNRMGIDLFETLSGPPVGNVKSIADAFSKLDPRICTRGNVGLDILLSSTPKEIRQQCREILKIARDMNRKHILAASDYLFYQVPTENIRAMAEAVAEFGAGG